MRSYKKILDYTVNYFKDLIIEHKGIEIETENFGWDNFRYVSNKFRLLHLEVYNDKKLNVIHLTCFPKQWSEDPIFGFDIIISEKKPLAAFCDWSPILNNKTYIPTYLFEKKYHLPEWANNIFSNNAIAIIPQEDELEILCYMVIDSFKNYLNDLSEMKSNQTEQIKQKQNYYCEQQCNNKSTFNVLKSKIGEDKALYFMENILFPKIISNTL